jgi:hypothetical protein
MTQIGFDLSEAHEALDDFLNGERCERWIAAGDKEGSEPLAYIVPAAAMERMRQGYSAWIDAQEVADELTEPPGYAPWRHSPLATTDRLLPTEPLEDPLAYAMFGKPHAELSQPEQDRVLHTAIVCLLRVRHDPDGQGAVPILMVGHEPSDPGPSLRWQVAFATDVPGLFLRVTGNGFFGEEWGIVTGSGYRVASGWHDRDDAARAVSALGRVLPNTDWMRLTPDAFTPAAKTAIGGVLQRYHFAGLWEDKPEPGVVADEIPGPLEGAPVAVPHPDPALD